MQIAVTFRHMDTDEGTKDYVKEKVERLQKYIENPREVHVVLSTEKFRHIAEITIIADGVTLNSEGRKSDLYAAIDQMVDKMERQIRGKRGKVKRKRPNSASRPSVVPEEESELQAEESGGAETLPSIRRRRVLTKPMSLEEAVAQFRLSREDVLFFINSDSEQMNALYRGKDGEVEWVEPERI
jgi:putative sigma-54 modulation protein